METYLTCLPKGIYDKMMFCKGFYKSIGDDLLKPVIEVKKKICLLGSYGVGKTSLVRRFVYNKFEEKYLSTIGVHISSKKLKINSESSENNSICSLFIWDIANIEKFDSITKNYLNGAHAAVIVFDLTRPGSLIQTDDFVENFMKINPNAKIVFVGNKIDLKTEVKLTSKEIEDKFSKMNNSLFLTSAKTGENVEKMFEELGQILVGETNSV